MGWDAFSITIITTILAVFNRPTIPSSQLPQNGVDHDSCIHSLVVYTSWTPKGYSRPPVGLGSLRPWN
jgi:hypothetical protein